MDKVRERAGIPSVDEAWDKYSTNPGYQNTQEGMREIVRAERMNELYLEGHKFFDIRRWKIAEQHCGMPDRGLNTNATKVEDFTPMDLPLPRNFHKGQYLIRKLTNARILCKTLTIIKEKAFSLMSIRDEGEGK